MNFQPDSGFTTAKRILEISGLPIHDQTQLPIPMTVGNRPQMAVPIAPDLRPRPHQDQACGAVGSNDQVPEYGSHASSSSYAGIPTNIDQNHQQDLGLIQRSDFFPNRNHPPRPMPLIGIDQGAFSKSINGQLQTPALSAYAGSTAWRTPFQPYTDSQRFALVPPLATALGEGSTSACQGDGENPFLVKSRPASAPVPQSEAILADSMNLNHMFPPRRELPFPTKAAPVAADDNIPSQDKAQEPTPEKVKGPVKKETSKKSRAKAAPSKSRPKKPPQPRLTPRPAAARPPAKRAPRKTTVSKKTAATPLTDPSVDQIEETPRKEVKVSSPFVDEEPTISTASKAPQAQPSKPEERRTKTVIEESPAEANMSLAEPSKATAADITPDELMTSLDTWIRKFQNLPVPQPANNLTDALAEYASKDDQERARVINNMICDCLENENFGKLVADVENTWMRIGLGF